jgi:hypothetical protein
MLPPPPDTQPSPPPALLHQESIAQIANIDLSSIHARLPGQGLVDCPALQPAPVAHAPAPAVEGSGNLLDASPAPSLPPPAAGQGLDTPAAAGAPDARCPPPSLRGNGPPHTGSRQLPTPARPDDPPATPTPSRIGAFLEDARGRAMDDHHARHRSRSRSPPRGSRHPALVRPRALRGRPSGDRSPRVPSSVVRLRRLPPGALSTRRTRRRLHSPGPNRAPAPGRLLNFLAPPPRLGLAHASLAPQLAPLAPGRGWTPLRGEPGHRGPTRGGPAQADADPSPVHGFLAPTEAARPQLIPCR